MQEKRVNLRISDPYILNLLEKGKVQNTLEPLVTAGGLLRQAGVLEQLVFLKEKGIVDEVGSLESLRLAIDFAEKIKDVKKGRSDKEDHKNTTAHQEKDDRALDLDTNNKKSIATNERKNAFS